MNLRILIADDENAARYGLAKALAKGGYQVSEAADCRSTVAAIRSFLPDLIFLDLNMPDGDGRSVLRDLASDKVHNGEVIILTANESVQAAVECIRLGAADDITKPYEVEQVRAVARRCLRRLELERRVHELQDRLDQKQAFGALVGISRPMQDLYQRMQRVAGAPIDVLIRGETGTGKELIARELHRISDRASGPFVAVNTAAIAASLAESELFGHVKGAFTGADRDRQGCFEQAQRGTLFLDEIGDMPVPAQTKILRVLQERIVQPVGSNRSVAVDVLVISATHQDLERAIVDGHFRSDLYYRIKGLELHVPPLRARQEDILLLANYFLDGLKSSSPGTRRFAPDAVRALLTHPWPGNVRELERVVIAAATLASDHLIHGPDLPLPRLEEAQDIAPFIEVMGLPLPEAKERIQEMLERKMIGAALEQNAGNISSAARQLGIHRQSLQQKMTQLGLRRGEEGQET